MKRNTIRNLIFACLLACTTAVSSAKADSAVQQPTVNALWVYSVSGLPDPVTDAPTRTTLMQNGSASGVNMLYVSVYSSTPDSQGRYLVDESSIATFITMAHAQGMQVYAALSSSGTDWLTDGCSTADTPYARFSDIAGYNAANSSAPFDGIMLDVEPGSSPDFSSLLALYQCFQQMANSASLSLGAAINAFWTSTVTYNGVTEAAYQQIIDLHLSSIVVMGYRNFAGTADCTAGQGILCLDEPMIAYANSVGRGASIIVGLNTDNPATSGDSADETFYSLGQTAMDSAAQSVTAQIAAAGQTFGGFAVHNYRDSYLNGPLSGWPATNPSGLLPAPTCSFALSSSAASLTQIGTASAGGVLPETPVAVNAVPASGAVCTGNYAVLASAPWVIATGSATGFTFIALTNPHPSSRSATLTVTNSSGGSATFTVTEAGDPEPLLDRQVRALYQSVLGRDPDSTGFAFWTGNGSAGLGQMLDSFLTSPEAFNSDFAVMATYQGATGAAPAYAQFTAAVSSIRAGSQSVTALFNSLVPAGYTVQSLYQNLFQRGPTASEISDADTAGLAAWFETLITYPSNTTPVTAPNNEFMNTGTFATAPDHSNGLYIALLYFVILGRDPDASGYDFWVGIANTGGPGILFQGEAGYSTRIQILGPGTPGQGFAGSPEFQGLYQ